MSEQSDRRWYEPVNLIMAVIALVVAADGVVVVLYLLGTNLGKGHRNRAFDAYPHGRAIE